MRAVLTNFGTTGDVYPFLALAMGLRNRGHEPILAFSPNFRNQVERLGFTFAPVGKNRQQVQNETNALMIRMPGSVRHLQVMFRILAGDLSEAFFDLEKCCRRADVIIAGPGQPAARMIHELSGIPFVSVQFSHFGGIGSPVLRDLGASLINPVRAQFGLKPLRDPLTLDANSPQLALYAVSRHIYPQATDRPAHHHLTGYFFLDDESWGPDDELNRLIESGDPPLVISFGSMADADPDLLNDLLTEAIGVVGGRAIIQRGWQHGWGRSSAYTFPSGILTVGYVPHTSLFPRARCIVHHGGAGTAAAVFRAGIPSVFVPHGHLFDQYYWALLARDYGCAADPLPYSQLTADKLAAAITQVTSNSSYCQKADALGRKIRSENGVSVAVQMIERLMGKVERKVEAGADPGMTGFPGPEGRIAKVGYKKGYQRQQRDKKRARLLKSGSLPN